MSQAQQHHLAALGEVASAAKGRSQVAIDHREDRLRLAAVAEYRYDGLNRRVAKLQPDEDKWDRTDYYYNASWQVLEERFAAGQASADTPATVAKYQYVWDLRYIDSPVLRDENKDPNTDSSCTEAQHDERLYYTTDANMNVTALVNTSGTVVERYVYDPYGKVTIYDPNWDAPKSWGDSKKNEILYCGYRYDPETGLYCVRERYYHPTMGRWNVRELLDQNLPGGGYQDGPSLYEYAKSGSLSSTDPFGLKVTMAQAIAHIEAKGDTKSRYMIGKLKARNVNMYEDESWKWNFNGETDYIWIECRTDSVEQAAGWLEDGIREWANNNRKGAFREVVREYAQDLKAKGNDSVGVLAETYDFAHKFSQYPSGDKTSDMMDAYKVADEVMWAFSDCDLSLTLDNTLLKKTQAKVNVTNNKSLSRYFLDFNRGPIREGGALLDHTQAFKNEDQTHHFAAFFALGVKVREASEIIGSTRSILGRDTPSENPGDFLLGVTAARLGVSYANNPRYMGKDIRNDLTNDPQKAGPNVKDLLWNASVHNAAIYLLQYGVETKLNKEGKPK